VAATVTPIRGINAFVRTRLDSQTQEIHRIETGVDAYTTRASGSVRYLKDELDANGNPPGKLRSPRLRSS
jgi:LPS-assembly protein